MAPHGLPCGPMPALKGNPPKKILWLGGGHKSPLGPMGAHGRFMVAPLFNKEATISTAWPAMGSHGCPGPPKKSKTIFFCFLWAGQPALYKGGEPLCIGGGKVGGGGVVQTMALYKGTPPLCISPKGEVMTHPRSLIENFYLNLKVKAYINVLTRKVIYKVKQIDR